MIKIVKLFTIITLDFILLFNANNLIAQGEIKSVKIGNQIWMAENLNVDHFRNGDSIPEVQGSVQWSKLTTGAWCYYENKTANSKKYGKLYNWYAVNDPRGLAPEGWHIPTKAEFETLEAAVNEDGNALKEIGKGLGNGAGTNRSGFSALLEGLRYYNGAFYDLDYHTYFWSSTEYDTGNADDLYLYHRGSRIYLDFNVKDFGFSVRCVKDSTN
ncbi:MAG: fibrobacter succinogenes major paralogous domain-containing protein [Ignavibacteriaceae bacterium]